MHRNDYIQQCREAKNQYDNDTIDSLNSSTFSSKKCWQLYKNVLGIRSNEPIPALLLNDQVITDDKLKATAFNDTFIGNTSIDDAGKHTPAVMIDPTRPSLEEIVITRQDVSDQLGLLDINKAYGPDGFGPRILNGVRQSITIPLYKLFNASLNIGRVPLIWKEANVIPLYKKCERSNPQNYRPVSLLNTTSKMF